MEQLLAGLYAEYGVFAVIISIFLNVLISIFALPSLFLTAANVAVFGPLSGFLVSWGGEIAGAYVAYSAYSLGLQKINWLTVQRYQVYFERKIGNLHFWPVLTGITLLRVIPFVPSGIVSILAAVGRLPIIPYLLGSAVGKIPSIAIEAGIGWTFFQSILLFF